MTEKQNESRGTDRLLYIIIPCCLVLLAGIWYTDPERNPDDWMINRLESVGVVVYDSGEIISSAHIHVRVTEKEFMELQEHWNIRDVYVVHKRSGFFNEHWNNIFWFSHDMIVFKVIE